MLIEILKNFITIYLNPIWLHWLALQLVHGSLTNGAAIIVEVVVLEAILNYFQ